MIESLIQDRGLKAVKVAGMPQEQCCKPINCCFILCPQRGHFLLFFPIRMV